MFTGLIASLGIIDSIDCHGQQAQLWVKTSLSNLSLGDSVAVDGVCVTVTDLGDDKFCCQLSSETLAVTIAAHYRQGQQVNVERPLQHQGHLDGHCVTGHVDQAIYCDSIKQEGEYTELSFAGVASDNVALLVKKGSVAINGVSLTINKVVDNGFSVMLIPHTLKHTNLGQLTKGITVNVEYDQLAKMVARQVQYHLDHLNLEKVNV